MLQNRGRSNAKLSWIGLLAVLTLLACDPGFRYAPVDWEEGHGGSWSLLWEGVTLRVNGVSGISGSNTVYPALHVTNSTTLAFAVREAELLTAEASYPGKIVGSGAVEAGADGRVELAFDLQGEAAEALGKTFVLDLEVLLGEKADQLTIEFTRTQEPWGVED